MGDSNDSLDATALRAAVKGYLDNQAQAIASNPEELWAWLKQGAMPHTKGGAWDLEAGKSLYFRGQADSSYGLTSSLYRECMKYRESPLSEYEIAAAEEALIGQMRDEGIGRRMTAGQLLMVLQHHGIPTRLIDVSVDPFVALFFAVERHEAAGGRLFLIHPHYEKEKLHARISSAPPEDTPLPWEKRAKGTLRTVGDWAVQVRAVSHLSMDPRMHAQEGQFLVGGLNRTWAGQRRYGGVPLTHRPDVSNLNLNFIRKRVDTHNECWGGTAWNVIIPSGWKDPLRARLASELGITADTMYPPLQEVARLARFAIRQEMHRLASEQSPST